MDGLIIMRITPIEGLYIRFDSTSMIDIRLLCILKVFLEFFLYFSTDVIAQKYELKSAEKCVRQKLPNALFMIMN